MSVVIRQHVKSKVRHEDPHSRHRSILVAFAAPAHAQLRDGRENPLTAARDLYASARYDEALAVLNGLPSDAVASDRKSIEQYRSLCLLALGRGSEAESAIAAVVTADPMFMPGEADASPRVRLAFSEVRQRLLPQIATTDTPRRRPPTIARNIQSAETQFRSLLTLLEDPQMGGRLPDLRTLATGFVDLAARRCGAAARAEEGRTAGTDAAPAPAAPVAPREPHVWTAEEAGVDAAGRAPPGSASGAHDDCQPRRASAACSRSSSMSRGGSPTSRFGCRSTRCTTRSCSPRRATGATSPRRWMARRSSSER